MTAGALAEGPERPQLPRSNVQPAQGDLHLVERVGAVEGQLLGDGGGVDGRGGKQLTSGSFSRLTPTADGKKLFYRSGSNVYSMSSSGSSKKKVEFDLRFSIDRRDELQARVRIGQPPEVEHAVAVAHPYAGALIAGVQFLKIASEGGANGSEPAGTHDLFEGQP